MEIVRTNTDIHYDRIDVTTAGDSSPRYIQGLRHEACECELLVALSEVEDAGGDWEFASKFAHDRDARVVKVGVMAGMAGMLEMQITMVSLAAAAVPASSPQPAREGEMRVAKKSEPSRSAGEAVAEWRRPKRALVIVGDL
jgi:hypothetical protein